MRFFILTAILLLIYLHIFAQAIPPAQSYVTSMLPNAPTTAGLGRYGNTDVSLFTGKPKVEVPLTEVKSGTINFPVFLSYDMGGIRVEQEPTVVGLGWNLNAGGVITRQMKGRPDNEHNGWLHNGYYLMNKYLKNLFTPIGKSNFLDAAAKSEIDTEPDEYTVITPHFSFKFTYDSVKNIIQTSPFAHYDIKYDSIVDCWTVKADNGFSYYFSETELTEPDLGDFPGVFPIISYVSSWYISSIRNDNGDIVLFEYENYEKTSSTKSETDYLRVSINTGTCTDLPAQTGWASTKVYGKALSRISYENSCLEFFRNSALLSDEGRLIYIAKREDGCNLAPTIRYNFVYDGVFLKEIQTQSSTCFQPPYIFEYLPCSFLHQKQDHWGFANENLNAGTTLLPEIRTRDITLNSIVLPGAYRGTDKNKVKQGSLYKITYPTGGHTMFDMEVNTVENNDIMRPDFSSEMCDFDDVSVFASLHNSATGIYSDSLTFSITEKQCVWIKGNARIIRTTADPAILSVQCDTFPMQSCSVEMPNTTCTINLDETYVLSPGTYTISVNGEYGKVDVDIKVYIKNDPFKMNVGGLRVKRITHHDGVNTANDKIFRYEYDYLNTSGEVRPSGNLTMMPKYGYSFIYLCEEIISISGPGTIVVPYIYFARSSSSLQSIVSSNGNFVEYSHIRVLHGEDGENGKEEYQFTSVKDGALFSDAKYFAYPFVLNTPNSVKRGLLKRHDVFKKVGSSFTVLKKTVNEYAFPTSTNYHYKENTVYRFAYEQQHPSDKQFNGYYITKYLSRQRWFYNLKTTVYEYDATGAFLKRETEYEYANPAHLKPTRIMTSASLPWSNEVKRLYYAGDFDIDSTTTDPYCKAIQYMQKNNQNGTLIEEMSLFRRTGMEYLKGAQLTLFKLYPNATGSFFLRPEKIMKLKVNGYSDLSFFTPAADITSLTFNKNANYEATDNFLNYTEKGRLLTHQKEYNFKSGLKWDSNQRFVIAKTDNAASDEFFYDSFESVGTINPDSKSGDKVFQLTSVGFNFNLPYAAGKKYIVSFWHKGSGYYQLSNGGLSSPDWAGTVSPTSPSLWQLKEIEITTSFISNYNLSGGGALEIDELRVFPKEAMMTTYSYFPSGNLKSQTEPSGYTIYYDYDSFNRLRFVKDMDGNILQRQEYYFHNNLTSPCR